jgi:hypothetical protein
VAADRLLAPRARELLDADVETRIAHIKKPAFVPYGIAEAILQAMEDLRQHPETNRPPNLLIVGRSNNGKTDILKEFKRRHPVNERPSGDTTHAPVIFIQAPPSPDDKLFLDRALRVFNILPRRSATDGEKLGLFIDQLRASRTRVMIIDELHSILAGPVHRQRVMLNTFKFISNDARVSVVAAGTAAARDAFATEPELMTRFEERALPLWNPVDQEYKRLLMRFEATLPLKEASQLTQSQVANAIYGLSGGTIGGIARAVKEAAINALMAGQEAMSLEIFDAIQAKRSAQKAQSERI